MNKNRLNKFIIDTFLLKLELATKLTTETTRNALVGVAINIKNVTKNLNNSLKTIKNQSNLYKRKLKK